MNDEKDHDRKVQFWREVVKEQIKNEPLDIQEEKLARFDKFSQNPSFIDQLEGVPQDKSIEDDGHEL